MKGTNFIAKFSAAFFSLFSAVVLAGGYSLIDEGTGGQMFAALPFLVGVIILLVFSSYIIFLAYDLLRVFWYPKPERLILDDISVEYDTGFPQVDFSRHSSRADSGFLRPLYSSRERFVFSAIDLTTIELGDEGLRNKLTIDCGQRRIELATNVTDNDREWLYTLLKTKYSFNPPRDRAG